MGHFRNRTGRPCGTLSKAWLGPLLFLAYVSSALGNQCANERLSDSRESVECLLNSGRSSLALLMAQRLLAEKPDDPEARQLLNHTLAAVAAEPDAIDPADWSGQANRPLWKQLLGKVRHMAWMGIELGCDTNINSATPLETIPIPLLNYRSLTLDPLLVQRPSPFVGLNGGAMIRKPLATDLAVTAKFNAAARFNSSEKSYLPHNYLGELSISKDLGHLRIDGELGMSQEWLAGFQVARRTAEGLRVTTPIAGTWSAGGSVTVLQNLYPQFKGVRTSESRFALEASQAAWGLSASASFGTEKAGGTITDLDRRYTGFSLEKSWLVSDRTKITAHAGFVRSQYLAPSPLFVTQRIDTAYDAELAVVYRLDRVWSLVPKLAASENRSSVPLVSFRRAQGMIELRRLFY